jgi:branched-chain amino acid transport system ATP-binding protein
MVTYSGVSRAKVEERAYAVFPKLGQRRTQLAGTMSGGEQQMLAVARAVACEPALLLLDELSMGLAPLVVEQLYDVVKQIAASGVTVLLVEQFAAAVLDVADTAVVMVGGEVVLSGAPHDVRVDLANVYLGGKAVNPELAAVPSAANINPVSNPKVSS